MVDALWLGTYFSCSVDDLALVFDTSVFNCLLFRGLNGGEIVWREMFFDESIEEGRFS